MLVFILQRSCSVIRCNWWNVAVCVQKISLVLTIPATGLSDGMFRADGLCGWYPSIPVHAYNEIALLQNFYAGRHMMQAAKRFVRIVLVILGVALVVGLTLAAIFKVLLDVLYVCLIILALLVVGATLFQIYATIALMRTIRNVRNEMKPLLASVQETVGIMKDTAQTAGQTVSTIGQTTKLTSEFALVPVIHTVASVVAMQGMMRVFLGKGHIRNRAERRREQQLEAMQDSHAKGGQP